MANNLILYRQSGAVPEKLTKLEKLTNPMNQITTFSAATANSIAKEACEALQALAGKHGLSIRPAGGSFDGNKATLKFEFRAEGEEAEKAAFAQNCRLFGAAPEHYGREAIVNGAEVKLVGFELNRSKFPIRCRVLKTGEIKLFTDKVLASRFPIGTPAAPAATVSSILPLSR